MVSPLSTTAPPISRTASSEQVVEQSDIPIFNLAKIDLTSPQIKVLSKGLSFVPSQKTDWFETELEVRRFLRTVRLKVFFNEHGGNEQELDTGLRAPSTFKPQDNEVTREILTFEKCVLRDLDKLKSNSKQKSLRHNLSKLENSALIELSNNPSIVIKPADKGGGIVVMSKAQYINMMDTLLQDDVSYKKLRKDPTRDIRTEIESVVQFALDRKWITEKESKFLITSQSRIPTMYSLPKIHKNQENPPGRPIVSGCGSILEPLCKFIDVFLKPISVKTETYLRDTTDTITIFENLEFDNTTQLLVTMDIQSLYTSIPQDQAIECMREVLLEYDSQDRVPHNFILELMAIALNKNYFEFNGQFFLQVKGTAMGAAFAPSLAILFMFKFETRHILSSTNPFRYSITKWKRYIDDIIFIWTGTKAELILFFDWLNNVDPNIKFTMESSNIQIPFLDLIIKDDFGKLKCSLFRKTTARNTLLHYSSNHPRHIRDNLPYGQFLRIRRNCSELFDYYEQADKLSSRLRDRGYPKRLITQAYKRARFTDRDNLLTPKQNSNSVLDKNNSQMTCVLTHGPQTFEIKKLISKYWPIVKINLPDTPPPRFAFKRGSNIRDKLVHSSLKKAAPRIGLWDLRTTTGHFPCGSCSVCQFTRKMKEFKIGPKTWTLTTMTNCKTAHVVYCIQCPCGLRYVGQTSRPVHIRISEHRSRIRCKTLTAPLVSHYIELQHSANDILWWILDVVKNTPNITHCLLQKEARWIHRLSTHINGLNEDFSPI
ncbi:uncharacterized protein [Ambystoma mexicanum]|uniref:uncharacterized protein n=1 Tax=Ambystoma mexicanum TaxID=8296 RepID=UPI0037E9C81A